eukprot:13532365-Alexandrium_andersonii.AAC.1
MDVVKHARLGDVVNEPPRVRATSEHAPGATQRLQLGPRDRAPLGEAHQRGPCWGLGAPRGPRIQ